MNELEALAWERLRAMAAPAIRFVERFAITYPENPARQELLDRLNTRWRDGEEPAPIADYYRAHL